VTPALRASVLRWLVGATTSIPFARNLLPRVPAPPPLRSPSPLRRPWARSFSTGPVVKLAASPSRLDTAPTPSSLMQGSHDSHSSNSAPQYPAPSFASSSSNLPSRPDSSYQQRQLYTAAPSLRDRISRDPTVPARPSPLTGAPITPASDPTVKGNRSTTRSQRGYAHSAQQEDTEPG
jgi:hypothetical protein